MNIPSAMLELVLACIPGAALALDEENRVVARNAQAARELRSAPGECLFGAQLGERAEAVGEGVRRMRFTLVSPEGREFAAELAMRAVSVDGEARTLVVVHELPDPSGAEQLLRSEVRLRQAVHVAQLGIFEHDHLADTMFFSPESRAIYGWGPELEATLPRILSAAHPRDLPKVGAAVARAHDPTGDGVCDIEGRLFRASGELRWIRTRSQTFFGERDGKLLPVRTVGATMDVTDSKQALEAQQQLVSILDATPDLVGIAQLDGTLLYVNRAARDAFGLCSEASIQEISADRFIGDELRRQLVELILPCTMRDGLWRGEVILNTLTAVERPHSLTVLAHPGSDEEVSFLSVIAHDLSTIRTLEEQARQSQKMEAIGRLAGGIAHDFNNLLSVILGYLDLAQNASADARLTGHLIQSRLAAERAADLTRQLLAFSRKQVLKPSVIDLGKVLREMQPMMRRLIGENIGLSITIGDDSPFIRVDKSQLEQVVLNLAVNARDAMQEGGTLEIDVRVMASDRGLASQQAGVGPGGYVMLTVSDSGVGMDAPTKARIFEPFFSTKGAGRGTGLGLATVFGIVKQSGGNISVESEPGRGTTFKLYFPRTQETPQAALQASATPELTLRNATIMVVEDEAQLRVMISTVLRSDGYLVIDAEDPLHALELTRAYRRPIDLLLTDLVMPHFSGKKLAELLLKERPEMRVIFMSGYTDETIVEHGVVGSGIHFLPKPIASAALRALVNEVLRSAAGG